MSQIKYRKRLRDREPPPSSQKNFTPVGVAGAKPRALPVANHFPKEPVAAAVVAPPSPTPEPLPEPAIVIDPVVTAEVAATVARPATQDPAPAQAGTAELQLGDSTISERPSQARVTAESLASMGADDYNTALVELQSANLPLYNEVVVELNKMAADDVQDENAGAEDDGFDLTQIASVPE